MIYVARFLRLALPCLTLLFLSCSESTTPTDVAGHAKAFTRNEVVLTANVDTNIVHGEQQIILTARGMPLIDGKGRIGIHGNGSTTFSSWIMDAPLMDTLMMPQDFQRVVWIPVEFRAGIPFEQQWTIRLLDDTQYHFGANAIIDSLIIPDTPAPVWPYSAEGRRFTRGLTYQFGVASDFIYIVRAR